MAKKSLDVAYEQYQEEPLDRFIAEELPKEEYDRLYAAYEFCVGTGIPGPSVILEASGLVPRR